MSDLFNMLSNILVIDEDDMQFLRDCDRMPRKSFVTGPIDLEHWQSFSQGYKVSFEAEAKFYSDAVILQADFEEFVKPKLSGSTDIIEDGYHTTKDYTIPLEIYIEDNQYELIKTYLAEGNTFYDHS